MDTYDVILAVVKFVGVVSTAAFAALGIVHDFKDHEKRLTPWGKRAIWGVVVSALLSTGSQSLEVLKAKQDLDARAVAAKADLKKELKKTHDELARSNELLYQVQRTLEPVDLNSIRYDVGFAFSVDDPAFAGYRVRLDAVCTRFRGEATRQRRNLVESDVEKVTFLRSDGRESVRILQGSPHWPDPNRPEERMADETLNALAAVIYFSNPRYPEERPTDSILAGRLDGRLLGNPVLGAELLYIPAKRRIIVNIKNAESSPIDASIAFRSIVDFVGAHVLLETDVSKDRAPSMSFAGFRISFGPTARSLIAAKEVQKTETDDHATAFEFKLVERWYK